MSALLLRRRFDRPLQRLPSQVQVVAGGAYDADIDASGPDEVAVLAKDVDRMRASIVCSSSGRSTNSPPTPP